MTVRIGVIGGGFISQAVHLPNLKRLADYFEVVALADPSQTIREQVANRFSVGKTYEDWRRLIDEAKVEVVAVCSPHGTHAEIVLAALDAGLHVFVEKPLCITVEDADRIAQLSRQAHRVVQVGYQKRYDVAFERMQDSMPESTSELRYLDVVTFDPRMVREPYFRLDELVVGRDVKEEVVRTGRGVLEEQVEAAIGSREAAAVTAYAHTYLACMIHDVNVVHGLLEAMGDTGLADVVQSGYWAAGEAVTGTLRLPTGARWNSTWLLLEGLEEFRETVSLYFPGSVYTLRFPAPYLRQAPALYSRVGGQKQARVEETAQSHHESYVAELLHFYDCVRDGVACRTPPEQARRDIALLRAMFLAADPGDQDSLAPSGALAGIGGL